MNLCKTCRRSDCTLPYEGRQYREYVAACASYVGAEPKTNADHIRRMSDEELAKEASYALNYCAPGSRPSPEGCTGDLCVGCWLKWLKQPYKEEGK